MFKYNKKAWRGQAFNLKYVKELVGVYITLKSEYLTPSNSFPLSNFISYCSKLFPRIANVFVITPFTPSTSTLVPLG